MSDFKVLPLNHAETRGMQRQLKVKFESVPLSSELGSVGMCYWNCTAFCERQIFANVVLGWTAQIWPNVLVSLMHHAVVQLPNGELLDITPNDYSTHGNITFVRDDEIQPDLDYPVFVPNRYFIIRNTDAVREWISAQNEFL